MPLNKRNKGELENNVFDGFKLNKIITHQNVNAIILTKHVFEIKPICEYIRQTDMLRLLIIFLFLGFIQQCIEDIFDVVKILRFTKVKKTPDSFVT